MTVNDLTTLYSGLNFVCGQSGGDADITYIDVVEIPGGAAWISPGNFVITTGYFIRTEADFEQMLKSLIENKSSGLGIKIGKYVKHIPESVRKLAEENHFPILSIPLELRYRDIQNAPHLQSMIRFAAGPSIEPRRSNATEFYRQAILTPFTNRYHLQNLALQADIPFAAQRIIFVSEATPEEADAAITELVEHPSSSFYLLYDESQHRILGIFVVQPQMDVYNRLRYGQAMFYGYCKWAGPLAVSELSSDALSLRSAYLHACFALDLGSWLTPHKKLLRYIDYLDYDLIRQSHNNAALQLLIWEYLQPVLDYDRAKSANLLPTLLALDSCNYNLQDASAQLHIHRNSLYARVEKLRSVMKYDIDEPNTRYMLHLGLMHYVLSQAGLLYQQ